MAFLDASLFLTAAAGDSLAISSSTAGSVLYDVTGAGSGNAPAQSFGSASAFGADMGIGDGVAQPSLEVAITTTLTTSTAATLQVALQSAPDNGSNAPGTWTTVAETDAIAAANLVAGTKISVPMNKRAPGAALPRFYRVMFIIPGSTSFTAGKAIAYLTLNAESGSQIGQFASNFAVV